jgi:hypothetical protein
LRLHIDLHYYLINTGGKRLSRLHSLLLATVILIELTAAATAEPEITELKPIPLKQGVNIIPGFSSDGRDAQIVLGWRGNGNAHGYDVFMVMLPTSKGANDWNIVLGPDGNEIIVDQPHLGEDMVRSVRFVRGKVDGFNDTFLITATRDVREGYAEPAPARIEFHKLSGGFIDVGTTFDYFETVYEFTTDKQYCNAEYALQSELGLPARQKFEGVDPTTGC